MQEKINKSLQKMGKNFPEGGGKILPAGQNIYPCAIQS